MSGDNFELQAHELSSAFRLGETEAKIKDFDKLMAIGSQFFKTFSLALYVLVLSKGISN